MKHSAEVRKGAGTDEPFARWLAAQRGRDDPVGDLACDYLADVREGCMSRRVQSLVRFRWHLRVVHDAHPADAVWRAVERAAVAWSEGQS